MNGACIPRFGMQVLPESSIVVNCQSSLIRINQLYVCRYTRIFAQIGRYVKITPVVAT